MARIKITDLPLAREIDSNDMRTLFGGYGTLKSVVPTLSGGGVAPSHTYTVVGTYTAEDGESYVPLRNPWGTADD